jgi:WD40 repeat protein
MATSADGRVLLASGATRDVGNAQSRPVVLVDLARQTERKVPFHGTQVTMVALDPSGRTLVTGDARGAVRVGADAGEPHILLGHGGSVSALAVSPDGLWVASASGNEIRLWPMPDVSKPPLHTLPRDELMAKLGAFTNLEVAPEAGSPTGYALRVGPFPGWRDMPSW